MLPRHCAPAAASGWLKHPMASPPEPPLQGRQDRKIHTGESGASVQTPTSFCHQLNLLLLCSATKTQRPRSPLCPPIPHPSLCPSHFFLSCARAHTNKTLAGISAQGDRRAQGTTRAISSNGFCQATLWVESPARDPFIPLAPVGMSSATYQRKPQHEQPPGAFASWIWPPMHSRV